MCLEPRGSGQIDARCCTNQGQFLELFLEQFLGPPEAGWRLLMNNGGGPVSSHVPINLVAAFSKITERRDNLVHVGVGVPGGGACGFYCLISTTPITQA